MGLALASVACAALFSASGARTSPERAYTLARGGMMRTRTALFACAAICLVTAVAALLARSSVP